MIRIETRSIRHLKTFTDMFECFCFGFVWREDQSEVPYYGVSTFTPRSNHISNAMFTRSLLLAVSVAAGRHSAPWDRAMAGLLLFVDSLLNHRYL